MQGFYFIFKHNPRSARVSIYAVHSRIDLVTARLLASDARHTSVVSR